MATAKNIRTTETTYINGTTTSIPSDGSISFDVKIQELQEAEACMDRLIHKRQQLADITVALAEEKLLGQMDLLAERSRMAPPSEVGDLTYAMISIKDALGSLQ